MTPKEKEMKLEVELLGAGVDSLHSQNFNFENEVYSFLQTGWQFFTFICWKNV